MVGLGDILMYVEMSCLVVDAKMLLDTLSHQRQSAGQADSDLTPNGLPVVGLYPNS